MLKNGKEKEEREEEEKEEEEEEEEGEKVKFVKSSLTLSPEVLCDKIIEGCKFQAFFKHSVFEMRECFQSLNFGFGCYDCKTQTCLKCLGCGHCPLFGC